jgi:TorA maturation chaperone TorD
MNTTAMSQSAQLAQADLLLLCADLLRRPTSEPGAFADALAQLDELLAAAGLPSPPSIPDPAEQDGVPQPAGQGPPPLPQAMAAALAAAVETSPDQWSDEYHRLFDAAMACPPNQTAYVRRDKGAIISDITGFYNAFGFVPRPETGEKPDHIVTELEFAAVLLVMAAAAEGDEQRQDVVRRALASFATGHLNDWLCIFAGRLELVSALPLYGAIACALHQLWVAITLFHALPSPAPTEGDRIEEPESPYECGMAEAESAAVDLRVRGDQISPD